MNANAFEMMVLPVVVGLGLGVVLGVVGLTAMRWIEAAAGLGDSGRPRGPKARATDARWHPIVVGLGPGHRPRTAARP